jgi:hypothetical protein
MSSVTVRRALLVLPMLPVVAAGQGRAAPITPLRFRIVREGSPIGTHRLTFSQPGEGRLLALTEVEIAVRLAGITVFRFGHRFEEVWSGDGRLLAATSRQDRNGRVTEMQARADAAGIAVRGPDGEFRLPAQAVPLTWWDLARIESGRPFFGTDTGKALRLGWSRVPAAAGARSWRCTGDADAEAVWAADGTWTAWQTRGDDGSTVRYERA